MPLFWCLVPLPTSYNGTDWHFVTKSYENSVRSHVIRAWRLAMCVASPALVTQGPRLQLAWRLVLCVASRLWRREVKGLNWGGDCCVRRWRVNQESDFSSSARAYNLRGSRTVVCQMSECNVPGFKKCGNWRNAWRPSCGDLRSQAWISVKMLYWLFMFVAFPLWQLVAFQKANLARINCCKPILDGIYKYCLPWLFW